MGPLDFVPIFFFLLGRSGGEHSNALDGREGEDAQHEREKEGKRIQVDVGKKNDEVNERINEPQEEEEEEEEEGGGGGGGADNR